jgi:hypothetical protein
MNGENIDVVEGCAGTIAPKVGKLRRRDRLWEHPWLSRFVVADIGQVTIDEIITTFRDKVPNQVLEVLSLAADERPFHVLFWHAGGHYFYDEANFGEVVDVLDLTYDSKYGLVSRLWFDDDDDKEDEYLTRLGLGKPQQ